MRKSFVYFAQAVDGAPIKIGFSFSPAQRVESFVCPLTGLQPKVMNAVAGGRFEEAFLHSHFLSHAILTARRFGLSHGLTVVPTEWFMPTDAVAREMLTMTNARLADLIARPWRNAGQVRTTRLDRQRWRVIPATRHPERLAVT